LGYAGKKITAYLFTQISGCLPSDMLIGLWFTP